MKGVTMVGRPGQWMGGCDNGWKAVTKDGWPERWTGGNGLVVSHDAVGVINWLEVVNDEVATVPHGYRYWTR